MESRLAEKLKLAGGVVARQHKKIEDRDDAIIAREADIERKTDQAFSPHESMLDAAEKGLDALEHQLAGLSNDPLQNGERPAQGEQQTTIESDQHPPLALATNRQGRLS